MRAWGLIVSGFYVVAIAALSPAVGFLIAWAAGVYGGDGPGGPPNPQWNDWIPTGLPVLWVAILAAGPLVLLFVRVDTSRREVIPQRALTTAALATALAMALLSAGALAAVAVAILTDNFGGGALSDVLGVASGALYMVVGSARTSATAAEFLLTIAPILVLWLVWGIVLYRNRARLLDRKSPLYRLLVKGSVAELLIVVPCHAVVTHRNECCAPIITGYGIATGLALLLMSFGPGVYFLFDAQMTRLKRRRPG